jgi:hypothetical protein
MFCLENVDVVISDSDSVILYSLVVSKYRYGTVVTAVQYVVVA